MRSRDAMRLLHVYDMLGFATDVRQIRQYFCEKFVTW